ncbi:MAG: DUF3499 domain-containing protein [Actinobacteria bacterium]|nr:DUF3499 domain-containing protein [Actinomycetota bacterium]
MQEARRRQVVRPLSRAAVRGCARPGCPTPAAATLRFSYGARKAVLSSLTPQAEPEAYDLCIHHADRSRPPRGWELLDGREVPPVATTDPAEGGAVGGARPALGGLRIVEVLAAALGRGGDPTAALGGDGDPAAAPGDEVSEAAQATSRHDPVDERRGAAPTDLPPGFPRARAW